MKTPRLTLQHVLLFGIITVIASLALLWGWRFGDGGRPRLDQAPSSLVSFDQAAKNSAETYPPTPSKAGRDQMLAELDIYWKRLGPGVSPDQAQKLIEEMTTMLWTGDPSQVGAAIRAFLDSGRDAATGLPFRVGEGILALSPSLRVALLDLLERLDLGEAADYAEVIVGRMEQPDEVAVALRTLMHLSDEDPRRQLAMTGVDRLLQRADWKKQPTGGYLEAFDIATQTENTVTWKRVLALTSDHDAFEGTQAAAGLAAHTLAVRSPEFRQLIARRDESTVMSPIMRGQLMARLDPRIPEELAALNTFVTDPAMTQEEAQAFAANFPSQRDLVGFRLVSDTENNVRAIKDSAQLDMVAYETLKLWPQETLSDSLASLMPDLSKRLASHATLAKSNN